jgi:hypothetical protein
MKRLLLMLALPGMSAIYMKGLPDDDTSRIVEDATGHPGSGLPPPRTPMQGQATVALGHAS